MTRLEKIKVYSNGHHLRWCKASVCACMGCVNKVGGAIRWKEMFPEETKLTEQEVIAFNAETTQEPPQTEQN